MSAYRDQTQGVAFVYKNLYELYQKSKLENNGKGIIPDPIDVMVFKPRLSGSAPNPIKKTILNSEKNEKIALEDKLKQLQEVHIKLRNMLNDLNEMVEKKKKS